MGTGKTTVGRLLAERLGLRVRRHRSADRGTSRHHCATSSGQSASRASDASNETWRPSSPIADRLVISTGGRMMLDPHNVASLSRNGRVFCLVATPDEIFDRVVNDDSSDRASAPVGTRSSAADRRAARRTQPRLSPLRAAHHRRRQRRRRRDGSRCVDDVRSAPICDRQPERRLRVLGGRGDPALRPSTGANRGPDGRRHQRRSRQPLPGELWRRRPDDHAAGGTAAGRRTWPPCSTCTTRLLEANVDRSATIVSLGDSIVGDVAGFAAATYFRGLDLVHCPTDLIAMIDTSIGGKVGLDVPQGKNLDRPVQAAVGRGRRRGNAADAESPSVRLGNGRGGQACPDRRFAPARPTRRRRVARAESRGT